MKVFNLRCSLDHRFEGWFGSEEDYLSQVDRGLAVCPMCGDPALERLPTAPRLNIARPAAPERTDEPAVVATKDTKPGGASRELTLQSMWMQAVRHVMANTDDVGDRFAEEARRIHYGEVTERAIRGRATSDEAEALRDEGIEVMALPLPPALKGPLQ